MINTIEDQALVSIIIPTFNRSRLLRRAIYSVMKQSYKNIETIVVDDGSTDDTGEVIREISREASCLVYIKKENGGCASARNRGLTAARGRFISFLDSDDALFPTAVETMITRLQETGIELVYSPSYEIFRDSREEINYPVAAGAPMMLAEAHFLNTNVRPGSFIFSREALGRVGFQDENLLYNEDSDYFQRLAIQCMAAYSPDPTLKHFHHQNNKSNNRVEICKALLNSSEKILAEHRDFAMQLGEKASIRLRQIKNHLVEALAIRGDFDEAQSVAAEISDLVRLNVKLAIFSRSNILLRLEVFIRKIPRYLKRIFLSHTRAD
jgi:glycosyltransferase involved in cell wall biosynthesis